MSVGTCIRIFTIFLDQLLIEKKLFLITNASIELEEEMDKRKIRWSFYSVLIAVFYIFFLLHWNGMFSFTYYWVLEATNSTNQFLPQLLLSFVSSVILFGAIALLFEVIIFLRRTS